MGSSILPFLPPLPPLTITSIHIPTQRKLHLILTLRSFLIRTLRRTQHLQPHTAHQQPLPTLHTIQKVRITNMRSRYCAGQKNAKGLTACQLAERNGHEDLAVLLKAETSLFPRPSASFQPTQPQDLERPPTPTETRCVGGREEEGGVEVCVG